MTVLPSAPDPELTRTLAHAALATASRPGVAAERIDAALAAGVDVTAPASDPAVRLLLDGALLARAGMQVEQAAPVLAGCAAVAAAHPAGQIVLTELDRALAAADAVTSHVARLVDDADGVARPTTAVLAAATCAALMTGHEHRLVTVLDLAASLMVLTPAGWSGAEEAELWAGHCALAGWLAAALPDTGITELPGALAHTLSAATGRPARAGA